MNNTRRSPARERCIAFLFIFVVPMIHAQSVVEPESFGMSSDRLNRLNQVIQNFINEEKLAGAVTLVARGGRIIHLNASGYQDVESGKRMQTDSIFRIYSMTKPITSTALLMLYEQGHFQLDDPLEKYIPAFTNVMVFDGMDESGKMKLVKPDRKITVRDIFTHTGGISYGNTEHPVDAAYRDAGVAYGSRKLKDLVETIARMPLLDQPGLSWHYSFSHDIQAYLVEYFSGIPFEQYLDERIFTPLGMKDTSFGVPGSKLGRFTSMYSPPGGYKAKPPFAFEMTAGLERVESGTDSEYLKEGDYPAGGSGLVSTAEDYFRFAQMLLNRGVFEGTRLVGPKTVALMTSPHVPMGFAGLPDDLLRGAGYGLGVSVMVDTTVQGNLGSNGQFGWSGSASTHVIMDPRENLVAILMVQHRPSLLMLRKQFQTLVYQALLEPRKSE